MNDVVPIQAVMPCARGCSRPPESEDQEPVLLGARHGILCDRCFYRMKHALTVAADLVANMRWQVRPSGERRNDSGGGGGKRFPPLPLRAAAVDDADNLYAKLVSWSRTFGHYLGGTPRVATWTIGDDVMGLRPVAPSGAHHAMSEVADWYMDRLEAICDLSAELVLPFHDDLCWGTADAPGVFPNLGRYPLKPRPLKAAEKRECPVCGEHEVFVRWPDKMDSDLQILCGRCFWVAEPEKYGFYARFFTA